jgi:uncharacterized protein
VHRVPGHNPTSGEHKGIDDVLALYGQLFELSGGTVSASIKTVTIEGDQVVVVHSLKAERDGKTLDTEETIRFSFAGDKVSRLDETYADEAAEDAFWG